VVSDDLDMGLFSWLFGSRGTAPKETVQAPSVVAEDAVEPVVSSGKGKPYVPPAPTPERLAAAAYYDAERERAKVAGQTVKQHRAGMLGNAETKEALLELLKNGGADGLSLASSPRGMTLALPDGRLIDCKSATLRRFGIYCGRIVGTSYYPAGELPRRDGSKLGMLREPDNEHDANAVALTRGKEKDMVGYLAKGTAKYVARELDAGNKLVAHVVLKGQFALVTPADVWSSLRS